MSLLDVVRKHLPGEHDQRDHAGDRASVMRGWLKDIVSPFFFSQGGGKHRAPPKVNWWDVFDDQMESAKDNPKSLRGPIDIGDNGAYFIPMSTDPDSGDGYFYTSSGKRLWGRYGAAGVMVRSRDDKGAPVYLLAKRSAHISGGGGTWAVPGGALDKDEPAGEGALRELAEEIGPPPPGSNYNLVAADVNEVEDGWKYTTILAEVDAPFEGEAQDWETEKEQIGWFTEPQIKKMNLHPAMKDRLNLIFDLWHSKKGGAHAAEVSRVLGQDRVDVGKPLDLPPITPVRMERTPAPGDKDLLGTGDMPSFESRLGNCYELSARGLRKAPKGSHLIHGTIQGFGNPPLGHGWVEFPNGDIWEPISAQVWDRDLFYAFHQAVEVKRYTQEDANVGMLKNEHYGPWHPVDERGNPTEVTKHLPGLHNQKSHGNRGGVAPWLADGGGFLNEQEWAFHKWAYAYNIDGYKNDYDTWHQQTYQSPYLPWNAPDEKITQPVGAPDPDPPDPTDPAPDADAWIDSVMGEAPETPPAKPPKKHGYTVASSGSVVLQDSLNGPPNLTVLDKRSTESKKTPLDITATRLPMVWALAGVPDKAQVQLEIHDAKPGLPYGSTQHVGGDKFLVKVYVLPLDKVKTPHADKEYPDDALYVINNSLIHEMRHVGQHYAYPNMDSDYGKELASKGYDGNFYEKEAWMWGHYADPTGTKDDTTVYDGKTITLQPWMDVFGPKDGNPKFPGHEIWAIASPGWTPPKE